MLNTRKSHEQGFTIVEIMVAIGILAIVTAIAIPTFISQKKKSLDNALKSELMTAAAVVSEFSSKTSWRTLVAMAEYETDQIYEIAMSNAEWNNVTSLINSDPSLPIKEWKNLLKPLTPGEGTAFNVVFGNYVKLPFPADKANSDFCLMGRKIGSNNDVNTDTWLYWDQKQGKVMTSKDIAAVHRVNPSSLSCSDQAYNYRVKQGETVS